MAKALVVDDVGCVRYTLTKMLQRIGVDSESAANIEDAVSQLRRDSRIELVIVDESLPNAGAQKVLTAANEAVRYNDSGEVTPARTVLLVNPPGGRRSMESDSQIGSRAKAMGFAAVLVKPVNEHALRKCLQEAGQKSLETSLATECIEELARIQSLLERLMDRSPPPVLKTIHSQLEAMVAKVTGLETQNASVAAAAAITAQAP